MNGLGVIGLGYWGPLLVRNFSQLLGPGLKVCCDRDPAQLDNIAKSYPGVRLTRNFEDVLADPEIRAVAIATPAHTHYHLAKQALLANKAVLVEKPMTTSVEEAEELVDLAQKQGQVLMVDHVYLYSPAVRKIKELLDAGELGQLLYIDSVRINLGLFRRDVNVVWDLAPHDLSIIDHLVGRLPRSVATFGAIHAGQGMEDVAYLNLDFGRGLIANAHVNWLSPVKIRHMIVAGDKKSLVFNDLYPDEPVRVYDSGVRVREESVDERRRVLVECRTGDVLAPYIPRTEPLKSVVSHFVECVRGGQTPLTDGRAGLRIVRLLEAAERSIKAQGGRITL
jgi:predicted dehydrogenase